MTNPKEALDWYVAQGSKQEPKTIDEIRAEIPKAFGEISSDIRDWMRNNGSPEFQHTSYVDACVAATHILVDWAYEAGKAEAIVVPDNAAIAKADHEGYNRGYEDAAKDPKAWYVLDKNGEQVHIWDETGDGKVIKLGYGHYINKMMVVVSKESGTIEIPADECEKVISDTREQIKDDLINAIWASWHNCGINKANSPAELAEQFINRIEALEHD